MTAQRRTLFVVSAAEGVSNVLLLLAFARDFPGPRYSLLLLGDPTPAHDLVRRLCVEERVTVVSLDDAAAKPFDEVFVHSYAHRTELGPLLARLTFTTLSYHADGLRNRFVFPPGTDLSRSILVMFGWYFRDRQLEHEHSARPENFRIVSRDSVFGMWRGIRDLLPRLPADPNVLGPGDLLIAMRYWGRGPTYLTRHVHSVIDVLADLTIPPGVTRVVVKHDPRTLLPPDEVERLLRERLATEAPLVRWVDDPETRALLGPLDVLDFHLAAREQGPGYFFGFDGSPVLTIAATHPAAEILWPRADRLAAYFLDHPTANAVSEAIEVLQEAVAQSNGRLEEIAFDGRDMRTLVARGFTPHYVGADEPDVLRTALRRVGSSLGVVPDEANPDITLTAIVEQADRARVQADQFQRELALVAQERDEARRTIEGMRESYTWRATLPFRMLRRPRIYLRMLGWSGASGRSRAR